jgi:FlaA1/EpsC-like NDP-sugar epimerase
MNLLSYISNTKKSLRQLVIFSIDFSCIIVALCLAYLFRSDFNLNHPIWIGFTHTLLVVIATKPLVFFFSRMYRSMWRYASIAEAMVLLRTVSIASLTAVCGLIATGEFNHFSRVVFILDWGLLFALMGGSRFSWRFYLERQVNANTSDAIPTLIIGAGDAGCLLLDSIRRHPKPPYRIVGFIDDDPIKQGMFLKGVPVMGTTKDLSTLGREHEVKLAILAIPSAGRSRIRDVIRRCQIARVPFKILPHIGDLVHGEVEFSQIKEVELEDLLGREPAVLDMVAISSYLAGKRVMVTGAAGSIGSEICCQIARFDPAKLIIFDNAETPLYYIEKELRSQHPELHLIPLLGDIRARRRLETVFEEFRPEVVFHAAAYKHVPLVEYNPLEAANNNIRGTAILAETADRFGVSDFVMVSTDKAVNPTNVMGCTKRIAELFVQGLSQQSRTKFTTVRFGNVLGSQGSVVPLFKEQIRRGGPITITDAGITRYFMTIPEASQLVLQAGCLGRGGEIFVLEMGEPVLILDLAEELIRLSGLEPHTDIKIIFTGLRPGEKLYEELTTDRESVQQTSHEKIMVLTPTPLEYAWICDELEKIFEAVIKADICEVMEIMHRLVPEFVSDHHFGEAPPSTFRRLRPDLFPGERRRGIE